MNTDFRNRMVLPFVLPILVLLAIAAFVGLLAAILLFNERETGLIVALVAAAGLMVAFSLASAVDAEDMTFGRRTAIVAAGALPIVLGGAVSLWSVNGGVPLESMPWYYEPVATAPEGAVVGAKSVESFCAIETVDAPEADCTPTEEVTLPAQPDAEEFAFDFVNYQTTAPHNFQIFELESPEGDPGPGELLFGVEQGSATITGTQITYRVDQSERVFETGEQFYYNCVVHPVMQGVLTIGDPVG